MGLPSLQGSYLPHGRWACDVTDVEAQFVTGQTPERQAIWNDWLKVLAVLKQLVGTVPAAWLSGSFLSSKSVPSDIDSVFIIDIADMRDARLNLPPEQWFIVEALSRGVGAREYLGLNVDSYILEWHPTPTPEPLSSPQYYNYRGYWDDLWVRAKAPADERLDSVPRRGYVEVIIDGYQ